MLRTQTVQDHTGVFDRLVGRNRLVFVGKILQHRLNTGVEACPVQAMFEIMASKDFQRFFESGLIALPDCKTQQPLDAVPDKTENFFNGAFG